jgi:uncharacterized membrane protein YhaH (DUF805 family)
MKFFYVVLAWVIFLAMLPGIKVLIDAGVPLLQSQGVAASDVAWIGILPWTIPMAWFVGTIMYMVKPAEPRMPQYQPPAGKKPLF